MTYCHNPKCRCHVLCRIFAWLRKLENRIDKITSNGGSAIAEQPKVFHVRETAPVGTDGITTITNGYTQRPLDTEVTNEIPGAALSADGRFILPAGVYDISGSAVASGASRHRAYIARLDSSEVITGTNANDNGGETLSLIKGRAITTQDTEFLLWHYTEIGHPNGGGLSVSDRYDEVYAELWITKVA